MLVAFIHGVATKDVQFADKLKGFIKEEFIKRSKPYPHFLPIWFIMFIFDSNNKRQFGCYVGVIDPEKLIQ